MSQTQKSNKSKLQTIVKDKIEEDTKTKEDLNIEEPWRLLLHNDDVHTFEYVTYMIQKIIPTGLAQREGVPADDDDALTKVSVR